ncbi:hypothetical protein PBI_MIMI_299 [Arthrobacter phage Mimi]|nr:hypothetical protein PBI_MIMI_93 [Arthrobacter phage Mimi]
MTYPTDVQEDLNAAKYLLNKHGFAFKIYGRDDVIRVIFDNYGTLPESQYEAIVKHVMEGEDWPTMSDHTNDDENNLIALVDGTKNDHPEWFQKHPTKAELDVVINRHFPNRLLTFYMEDDNWDVAAVEDHDGNMWRVWADGDTQKYNV